MSHKSATNTTSNDTSKLLVVVILAFVGVLIYLIVRLDKATANNPQNSAQASNTLATSELNGVQYIDLTAKGGYFPNLINAKADEQTTLRVKTSGTFDCSSSLVIPSLGYRTNLPPTGETNINIPAQKAGTQLLGMCGMGMYRFKINFN